MTEADIDLARSVGFAFRLGSARDTSRVIGEVERGTRDWRTVAFAHDIEREEIDLMASAFETPQRAAAQRIGGTNL